MVRTLVFHINNVGSIPTSLSIANLNHLNFHSLTNPVNPYSTNTIRYSFRFTSIVAPSTIAPSLLKDNPHSWVLPKRTLVKRSYAVLSWMYYLTRLGAQSETKFKPSVAILPARKTMYTLTKAPMAHKTNSKEQFLFKFYNFKFSFNLKPRPIYVPTTVQQGAHVMALTRRLFPVFETNLLFLKYYEISYPVRVTSFLRSLT